MNGNFVMERMRYLRPFADLFVVAPVPFFPRIPLNRRWYEFSQVPYHEELSGFRIDHPRYLVFPKFGMATHGVSMFLGSFAQVRRRSIEAPFDLIDAHFIYPDGLAAVMLGAMLGKPVVISARGSDINQVPKFNTIRPLIRKVLRRADALIAVSQSLKDVMVDLGCPSEKVTVIGNGVDSVKFSPRPRAEMRLRLGLPLDRPILLSVGHLTERKGFHVLIDAIGQLRHKQPDVLLCIVGDGVYRSRLEHQIRRLGVQDHVKLVGARDHSELYMWYSAAEVFCLASSREGWANVLLEAMACGIPTIATRVWGAPEIVVSDAFGILVRRSAAEFTHAAEQALSRQWNHDAIREHAQRHTWENVAQRILRVYSEVFAGGGAPAIRPIKS